MADARAKPMAIMLFASPNRLSNHIAAVFLPALLGLLWVVSPGAVFGLAAAMALATLLLAAAFVPEHPLARAPTFEFKAGECAGAVFVLPGYRYR